MDDLSYQQLIDLKLKMQNDKEQALRDMTPQDWEAAQANFDRASAEGLLPPKIKSRRRYEGGGF